MVKFTEEAQKKFEAHVPIEFYRPIRDKNGEITHDYYITDHCNVYRQDDLDKADYLEDIKPIKITRTEDNRVTAYVNSYQNQKKAQSLARVLLRSFDDDPTHDAEYFASHEANHINPDRPLDNSIDNLEWTTRQENMYKAGESGVMIKKYDKDLIHDICQMIVDGCPRAEIMMALDVNGQLVDDIHAGRSHKSVSCQYLDKGFEYRKYDKEEKRARAEKVCKLIVSGYTDREIMDFLNLPNTCVAADIRAKRAYKYISCKYF